MDDREAGMWKVFFDAMKDGDTSRAILNQEARGQRQVVNSDRIPRDMMSNTREQFEALGFVFGEHIDDLFVSTTLPPGWSKVGTDHSMWSKIIDEKGRERASIFYKAAFYDRSAHISLNRRFTGGVMPLGGYGENYDRTAPDVAYVKDCGEVIWQSEPVPDADYKARDDLRAQALAWLESHYPDYDDPLAYWDAD